MPETPAEGVAQLTGAGSIEVNVSVWHWYSLDQAAAAITFVRRCADLERHPPAPTEEERQRLGWSEGASREHRAAAVAAITSCVAFLEASINELYASAAHSNLQLGGRLNDVHRATLVETGEMLARNALLDRYQLTLHLLGSAPFDTGTQPFQDARLVVQLRNELVHYSPRWRTTGDERKFERALQSKNFALNPFTGEGNPFFPDKALGHGCADWAWATVVGFADTFFDRIGIEPVHRSFLAALQPDSHR